MNCHHFRKAALAFGWILAVGGAFGSVDAQEAAIPPSTVSAPGGIYHVGGSVKSPVLIKQIDPPFTKEEGCKTGISGVVINFIVDENGDPQDVKFMRPPACGSGEQALEAVRQYKFKPATLNGKAVRVALNVEFDIDSF